MNEKENPTHSQVFPYGKERKVKIILHPQAKFYRANKARGEKFTLSQVYPTAEIKSENDPTSPL